MADGWSIASRTYARTMALGGIDVRIGGWAQGREPDPEAVEEVKPFLKPFRDWDLYLFSSPIGSYEVMEPVLEAILTQPGKQAFQAVFERQQASPTLLLT